MADVSAYQIRPSAEAAIVLTHGMPCHVAWASIKSSIDSAASIAMNCGISSSLSTLASRNVSVCASVQPRPGKSMIGP